MRIEIAERLRPFSHLPGTSFVLPGSLLSIEIFPALIRVNDLSAALPISLADIAMDIQGPVNNFTALQDLENGSLRVWGKSITGFFRYSIKALEGDEGIVISLEKTPEQGVMFSCRGKWKTAKKTSATPGEKVFFAEKALSDGCGKSGHLESTERLSLGSHKLQDWEFVRRRLSFIEIFPIWYRLGQIVKLPVSNKLAGTALLLNDCRQAIEANTPEMILPKFRHLFLAGFEGGLSPRLMDTSFQGIKYQENDLSIPPLTQSSAIILLSEGAKLIRSIFVKESDQTIHVLPAIPPEFHCGRLLNVKCGKQGLLTLEWTKKSLRCMTFSALENQKIVFTFSNHEKVCRLRSSYQDKGLAYIPGSQIDIVGGQNYWFDNFQR